MRALSLRLRTRQAKQALFLELARHQLLELVECGLYLLLADADLIGQMGCHLRLRHLPPPQSPTDIEQNELLGHQIQDDPGGLNNWE